MATYLKEEEIRDHLDRLMDKYAEECRLTGNLNPDFTQLIKHSFYAKFVHYDATTEMIEIGINESKDRTPAYPDIQVYHYALSKTRKWLGNHIRNTDFDLEFYAELISRDLDLHPDMIVLHRGDE